MIIGKRHAPNKLCSWTFDSLKCSCHCQLPRVQMTVSINKDNWGTLGKNLGAVNACHIVE